MKQFLFRTELNLRNIKKLVVTTVLVFLGIFNSYGKNLLPQPLEVSVFFNNFSSEYEQNHTIDSRIKELENKAKWLIQENILTDELIECWFWPGLIICDNGDGTFWIFEY